MPVSEDHVAPDALWLRLDRIEQAPGDVVAAAGDYDDGYRVEPHRHSRAQLLHALSGVVMVSSREGRWMVPPDHAMWIPAGVEHSVEMLGDVRMRSVYVKPGAAAGLPDALLVLAVNGLMRSLIVEAVGLDAADAADARGAAIMQLILHELPRLEKRPFALPFPVDPRLAKLCRGFLASPSPHATIDGWASEAGMSRRSFTRAFQRETGLSLSLWRRQATLFAALPRLAEGAPITTLALDLGYDSAPAFTTMFRRMLGAPPRDYLRQMGRGLSLAERDSGPIWAGQGQEVGSGGRPEPDTGVTPMNDAKRVFLALPASFLVVSDVFPLRPRPGVPAS